MGNLSGIARKTALAVSILLLVIVAAGFAYYRSFTLGYLYFIVGAILGAALNIYKIIAINRVINRAPGMDPESAGNYARGQYLLRFLLTTVVLFAAALVPFINIWGTAAGIFTMPVATFFANRGSGDEWKLKF